MQKLGKFMAVNIYQNLPKTTKNFSTKQCPKVSAMADSFVSTNKKSF